MNGFIKKIDGVYPVTVMDAVYAGNGTQLMVDYIKDEVRDYDQIVKSVAHRGLSAYAPENTLSAYQLARQRGFRYAECDVQFTSDGVPVLCHDATINRTSTGTGTVSEMTYRELATYDFGVPMNPKYLGERIPTFSEFLALCRKIGLHPYIEVKDIGTATYTQEQINELVDLAKSHGLADNCTWISTSSTLLGYVADAHPTARLGFVEANPTVDSVTVCTSLKNAQNEVILNAQLINLTDEVITACISNGIPLEVWTVDYAQQLEGLHPYITGVTSNGLHAGKEIYLASIGY